MAQYDMAILGLDIGGANIKAANLEGLAISRPFAIWREPERLPDKIDSILQEFPHTKRIALTMTAELADCFSTKAEGVSFIIDAVETSAGRFIASHVAKRDLAGEASEIRSVNRSCSTPAATGGMNVVVWSTEGRFLPLDQARQQVMSVAAANWHALATWCGKFAPEDAGLLLDIGSTTTDMIPIMKGYPIASGLTDVGRMQSGELSYSGVWRTPLCAVAHSVPFRLGYVPLAAELFATTLDVYLLLDRLPEDATNLDTANGKPATKSAAHDRIARMLCCDRDEVSFDEAVQIARFLADVQRQRLAGSLERVTQRLPSACQFVVVSGSGSFLARQLVDENRHTTNSRLISLADHLSKSVSDAACAFAVARLASP